MDTGIKFFVLQDQFSEYMFQQAVKLDNRQLIDNKSKFVLVHSSSGFKHALKGLSPASLLHGIHDFIFQMQRCSRILV
jgi:hypothetical protein